MAMGFKFEVEFSLAQSGADKCAYGVSPPLEHCFWAVKELAHFEMRALGRASLLTCEGDECPGASWVQVPRGCSVQTSSDWIPHWADPGVPIGEGNVSENYQP